MKNILINNDCLDVLKKIKTESVDLIITDPPYKIISGGRKATFKNGDHPVKIFDKYTMNGENEKLVQQGKIFKHNDIKFKEWLPHIFRVLKNNTHCYIFINDRNMQEMMNEATKVGFKLVNVLVWKKKTATPNRYYLKNCEYILMFRKGKAKNINNMGTKAVLEFDNIRGQKKHPTEKPKELLKILLENSSDKKQLILDPFGGCGNLGVACIETNRNYILIEKDKHFFDVAKENIKIIKKINFSKI